MCDYSVRFAGGMDRMLCAGRWAACLDDTVSV